MNERSFVVTDEVLREAYWENYHRAEWKRGRLAEVLRAPCKYESYEAWRDFNRAWWEAYEDVQRSLRMAESLSPSLWKRLFGGKS